jgi:hypothetical protein
VWIEPVANRHTSTLVLAQERVVLAFAVEAAAAPTVPSATLERGALDVVQADAAAAVAGHSRLTVIIGPAGAGKTTMLDAAVTDLAGHGRDVFGVAPTAKAAAVLARETGMDTDTVAKLLHEWSRTDRDPEPRWRLPAGTTLIVDEAGMVSTPDLARLTTLAREQGWRLVLVGDPRQLQAVGRGGLLPEIARIVTPIELDTIHRFTQPWEAAASLQLRHGNPTVLDTYEAHGRIKAGTLAEHLDTITAAWRDRHGAGESLAVTVTTNDHARLINARLQAARVAIGELDPARSAIVRDGIEVLVGDVVATRRNLRELRTDSGEMVRNRDRWTVTRIADDGTLTLSKLGQPGTVVVPRDTARDTIELGYAVTEYGNQGDTHPAAVALVSPATSARGLYVAMTRGRHENVALVITDTHDSADARDVLESVLAVERVDVPATVQRRTLAAAGTPAPAPRPGAPARRVAVRPTVPLTPAPPAPPAPPAAPVPPASAPLVPVTPDVDTPAPSARAVVPVWFAEARTTIVDEMTKALGGARAMVDDVHQRRDAITAAAQRLDLAQAACEPFDARVTAAHQMLDAAVRERDTTADRAERARFLARRDAKTQLDVAERAVASARTSLAEAEHAAEPARAERRLAAAELDRLQRDHRDHGIIDSYNYDSRRAVDLERKLAAVDRWHEWANGAPMRPSEIARLYQELERGMQHDWLREDPAARLADTLKQWATDHDLVLPSPHPVQRGPEQYLGPEL